MPVISHGDNFGVTDVRKRPRKVKTLPGYVLVLVNDNVLEIEFLANLFLLLQYLGGVVYHILKVHGTTFLQLLGVLQITLMTNVQEEFGADIIGHPLHLTELVGIVTVGLEVLDKGANEASESEDVFVLLRRDNLLIDLYIGAAVQNNAFLFQLLLQMLKERTSVIVC